MTQMATNQLARATSARLELVKGPTASSTLTYRSCIRAFLAGGQPQTLQGFSEYVEKMKRERAASSVNLAIAAGRRAFLQSAERQGWPTAQLAILKSALAEIKPVKIQDADVRTITPKEREKVFAALSPRLRLIAETLYQTGARVSEIANLRRSRVREGEYIELRLLGKGAKERTVRITRRLYQRIAVTFADSEYLFTTPRGKRYSRQYISGEIARAAQKAIGRTVTAHVLRHSRATDLVAQTGKIKGVSRLLGHADESTTLHYYVRQSLTDKELFADA